MTKLQTRILICAVAALLLLSLLLPLTAFAVMPESYEVAFDGTDVMDDLDGATIFGKTFDKANYPKNENGDVRLLDLSEYCFSLYPENEKKFGIYVYVYNPTCAEIRNNSDLNKIQMAVAYKEVEKQVHVAGATGTANETQTVTEIEPDGWDKYPLKLLSKSADNLFYKFKIDDGGEIFERVSATPELRRYDLSGIELFDVTQTANAHEYPVGGTWKYSGYAKGCDLSADEQSTLTVQTSQNQVLTIGDLQHTFYRAWRDTESTIADQLNSVYFSVPKDFVNDYDSLYSIQAETYQYLSAPIFCIYDDYVPGNSNRLWIYGLTWQEVFNTLQSQVGKNMNGEGTYLAFDFQLYDTYNIPESFYNYSGDVSRNLEKLAWLIQVSDETRHFSVSGNELQQYMLDYSKNRDKSVRGKYSADLFADEYYSYALRYGTRLGYGKESDYKIENGKKLEFDVSVLDKTSIVGSSSRATFWERLFPNLSDFGGKDVTEMCPLIEVKYDDIKNLSSSEVTNQYFVSEYDVDNFIRYVRDEDAKGSTVYLFRFANSYYFNSSVMWQNKAFIGYEAQEVVYLDFDVISLGYNKNGVVTKIPVVSSPIDVISAIEQGKEVNELLYWLQQILAILAFIILLIFLSFIPGVANLLITLLKIVGWVILLPFRLIAWLFKSIFKRR